MASQLWSFLLSFGAILAMLAGPLVLLPVVIGVQGAYGNPWGMVALAVVVASCAGMMRGLAWMADRRVAHLEPDGKPPPPDRLFCGRCGAAVASSTVVCASCGGTRFVLASGSGQHVPDVDGSKVAR